MIIKFLKKIKHALSDELKWQKIKKEFDKNRKKKSIYLLGTPLHGNIGDQAITLAEYKFFEAMGYSICEVPSPYVIPKMKYWKKCINNEKIFVHGGGFIGTLWMEEELMFEEILKEFKDNQIVVLPQTLYFDNDVELINKLNSILRECRDVTICAREEESYKFATENIKFAKIELIPDMVLSQNWRVKASITPKVCFCMRKDHEKVLKDDDLEKMILKIKEKLPTCEVYFSDTVQGAEVTVNQREDIVLGKIKEFSECELVITDRLHGMVLSAMAGAKTLVCTNCNYKVLGIYNWIKNNKYISFIYDYSDFENKLGAVLDINGECIYDNTDVLGKFERLKQLIEEKND